MKRNLEEKEGVTYLSQLGKVSVPVKKHIQTGKREKHLQRVSNVLNTQEK